jgi:monoamine oxidase
MPEHHNIIIIGAGLSGLYAAYKLQARQQDVILLEARSRAGGRILSANIKDDFFDMGPAWVWPQMQGRLDRLLTELNLNVFKQYTQGDMLFEQDATQLERYRAQSSHSESYRVSGGNQLLIEALEKELQISSIRLHTQVKSIAKNGLRIEAVHKGKPVRYSANKIILALPPRLFQQDIAFNPTFADATVQLWEDIPTWMSTHCKIIFVYGQPFWREQKLSGEVFSYTGPLSEIYDGSPQDENVYALTAFFGLDSQQRKNADQGQLIHACLVQLQRLFGAASQNTLDIQIKDWSCDELTCSQLDMNSSVRHPQYPHHAPREFWNNALLLAGTEVAAEYGGYLEGALESADRVIAVIDAE